MADVRGDVRDGALPYGVDTLVLRIEWPAPAPQGYNGRMWRMRPLRGWTGGQAVSQDLSGLGDGTAGPSTVPVTGSETVEAQHGWAPAEGLAQGSQSAPGVQYAQRGPPEEDEATRRAGPGGRPLSDPELFRLELYNILRSQLEEIDPGNPELRKERLTGPEGFVPNQADVDDLGQALRGVRSGRPAPQGPVNTFDNPGGPDNSSELTRPQRGAVTKVDNIISNGAKEHDFEGVIKELGGESTGFDHVTEMRNNVRGLRDALGSIQGSLANPNLTPDT